MDSKTLNSRLSEKLGLERKVVSDLLNSFSKVISGCADSLTGIAIPSFGTFQPVKINEEIRTDLSSGKKILFPPQIIIEFKPATALRKVISDDNE